MELQSFLTSATYGGDCSSSRPGRFIPGKEDRYASESGQVAVEEGETHYPCENPNHDSCIVQPAAWSLHRLSCRRSKPLSTAPRFAVLLFHRKCSRTEKVQSQHDFTCQPTIHKPQTLHKNETPQEPHFSELPEKSRYA